MTHALEREAAMGEGGFLARVIRQHRELYQVMGLKGELTAGVASPLHQAGRRTIRWEIALVDRLREAPARVIGLAPKKLSRQAAGTAAR